MFLRLFSVFLLSSFFLLAEENKKDVAKVSEAFGHLIGKNLDTLGVDFDIDLVMKGLKDAGMGEKSPMTESECIEAITVAQEETHQKLAKGNLEKAETFLNANANNKDVVVLEKGKIQTKVDQKGSGSAVQEHFNPLILYIGTYLDGSVFGQSKDTEVISLDDSIPGFSKGLVGMQEGEKRTLYIHPEFAYGTHGYLPPNSLLTFEIEIVKANAPDDESADSLIIESQDTKLPSDLDAPVVR